MKRDECVFDRREFAERYLAHRDRIGSFNALFDLPEIMRLVGGVQGRRILEVGTGNGELASLLAQSGAERVVTIDRSSHSIEYAQRLHGRSSIKWVCSPIEEYEEAELRYDLIVSSLCLHFVKDIGLILAKFRRWIAEDGRLVFSVRHPIRTANPSGEQENGSGWLVSEYNIIADRTYSWLGEEVTLYHRTFGFWFSVLTHAGWDIVEISETKPSYENVSPVDGIHAPLFLSFLCSPRFS